MIDEIKMCNLCKKGINETSYFGVETRVPVNTQVYFHWTCWVDPYLKHCESKIKKAREEEAEKSIERKKRRKAWLMDLIKLTLTNLEKHRNSCKRCIEKVPCRTSIQGRELIHSLRILRKMDKGKEHYKKVKEKIEKIGSGDRGQILVKGGHSTAPAKRHKGTHTCDGRCLKKEGDTNK